MRTKEFDLLVKYLDAHDRYHVTKKQLDTIEKFKKWNDVSLQDIDRMKNIIEEYGLDNKDSFNLHQIQEEVEKQNVNAKDEFTKREQEIENEGIDAKRIGWHRKLHGYREYEKRQVNNDLEHGIER